MAEPAELLIIKDQYKQALHFLKRGMAAEEAGRRPEALEYYRTGRKHLAQGLEVPTGGARHQAGAPCWDTARQLQQKMRETLQNLICQLPELEESVADLTTEESGDHFYPALEDNILPPPSSLLHLYPSVSALLRTTNPPAQNLLVPTPAPPVRPASPNPSHQGATWLSKGFVKGAEATGKVIHRGASKLRDHITPENTPTEVSPRVNKNLQAAKQATAGAVRVSQFLVNFGVCTVAGCVGDKLAPHVKKHGAKLIPESMKKSKDGRASNLDAAMVVAASSVQGFSTMWSGLETGAKIVGKSVTSETVRTVKYKFRGLENVLGIPRNI